MHIQVTRKIKENIMNHMNNWAPRLSVVSLLAVSLFGAMSVSTADKADADAKLQIPRPNGKPADMTKPVQV